MGSDLIPALDAAGLPGPPWLFHVLLVFTFFLHMLFMNLTLGGTLLAWFCHLRAGGRSDGPHGALAGRMMAVNTFAISLTITTGVAPLLFIQLLYQQYFYSGTILLGWIWFAVIWLLIGGYYATYLYKFKGAPKRGAGGGLWLGVSAISFLLIAMIHVAAHLVHVQPALWEQFAAGPWSVLADPTYWPRLFHFIFAGIAFSALVIAWWAARRASEGTEVELNTGIARIGWSWALWSTAAQMIDGFILLFVLPREVLIELMRGGAATLVPLTLSIVLGIGLLVMLARSIDPVEKRRLIGGTLGALTLTVAVMSVTRHQIRSLYLAPFREGFAPEIAPQWLNFALFALLLVVALAVVGYMVRRVLAEPATGEEAA
jgi:hypothetical protein